MVRSAWLPALAVLWLALVLVGDRRLSYFTAISSSWQWARRSTIGFAAPLWAISSVLAVGLRAVERPETDFVLAWPDFINHLGRFGADRKTWGVPAWPHSWSPVAVFGLVASICILSSRSRGRTVNDRKASVYLSACSATGLPARFPPIVTWSSRENRIVPFSEPL